MRLVLLTVACACLIAIPLAASALDIVVNGDFEAELTEGWEQSTAGDGATILRGTSYDPDPDYEVYLRKITGTGHAKISQGVSIPSTAVEFSANLKTYAVGSGGAWAAAGLVIHYLDQFGSQLGKTAIASRSVDCPWVSSSTFHMMTPIPNQWETVSFVIADELTNLPGVDAAQVRRLEIQVVATAADC